MTIARKSVKFVACVQNVDHSIAGKLFTVTQLFMK